MRVFVLATMFLVSSSLCSFAEEQGKAPPAAPPAVAPIQTDQNSPPQPDQKTGSDQSKPDDREMGRGGMMRRDDGGRMGRSDREMGRGGMMRRDDGDRIGRDDREMGRGGMMRRDESDRMGRYHDKDLGRNPERGDRDGADRDRDDRGHVDADWPRRRVKVCLEFQNGDEYCRYGD